MAGPAVVVFLFSPDGGNWTLIHIPDGVLILRSSGLPLPRQGQSLRDATMWFRDSPAPKPSASFFAVPASHLRADNNHASTRNTNFSSYSALLPTINSQSLLIVSPLLRRHAPRVSMVWARGSCHEELTHLLIVCFDVLHVRNFQFDSIPSSRLLDFQLFEHSLIRIMLILKIFLFPGQHWPRFASRRSSESLGTPRNYFLFGSMALATGVVSTDTILVSAHFGTQRCPTRSGSLTLRCYLTWKHLIFQRTSACQRDRLENCYSGRVGVSTRRTHGGSQGEREIVYERTWDFGIRLAVPETF
jgi:hypothetical protein